MDPARLAALALIPEAMATVYQILPLRYEAGILTIAMAADDEGVKEDLKRLLGLERVDGVVWPKDRIREGIAKDYVGQEDSVSELLRRLEEGRA